MNRVICGHCRLEDVERTDAIAFGEDSAWHCRSCGYECLVKYGWIAPVEDNHPRSTVTHDEETGITTVDGQAFRFS